MINEISAFVCVHLVGDTTTHPLLRLGGPPAFVAPRCIAASTRPTKRTIGRVQLWFLG